MKRSAGNNRLQPPLMLVIFAVLHTLITVLNGPCPALAETSVTDEMGRRVVFQVRPKRIIVLTGYPAEVLCALGEGERIVGISNPEDEFLPEIRKIPSVGKSAVNPNLEILYELKPDLVIAYQWTKKEVIEQLETWGIPVLCYRVWTMEEVNNFIIQMGELFGREDRAKELQTFIVTRLSLIEEVTRHLQPSELPEVFMEVFNPYQTTPAGKSAMQTPWGKFMYESPMQVQMNLAGGINCVGKQPTNSPRMSPEWLVEKNPDIFIKVPLSGAAGVGISAESMKKLRDEIVERAEIKRLAPVLKNKIFVIHPRLCAGPRQIVGICYYAKWFHPGRFDVLSPRAIHAEMLKRFWGIELQGVWGYPEP